MKEVKLVAKILNARDLEFMLYELFDTEAITQRPRYQDHSRETFNATLDTAVAVAEKYLLPIRHKVDNEQPQYVDGQAKLIPEVKVAVDAIIDAGLAYPTADYEIGGMQLPQVVSSAVTAYLTAAGGTLIGYTGLTEANCNLIEAHGTQEQIERYVAPMRAGRFAGTMAMTEPGAGSGLADLTTSAVEQDDGTYRLTGNKIFISGGDQNLTENIIHLVLARVKGAPAGVGGISLLIVPKILVNDDGSLGDRNDVALAGLFHKMGGRASTSTALNFGENDGAVGYLVGEENLGLRYMFHMMNEVRVFVGCVAAAYGLTAYQYSLDYAKERIQGRLLSCKDPLTPPVKIIEHPDVRRMLLAQKAYSEGAFALCLLGSQLYDDLDTAETEEERKEAALLLEFLIPIIKAWPSDYCVRANSLAIQVLGGHGYTSEHPVELFYRDNRLNPIHEGTNGIQSLDLLTRKVPMQKMAGYKLCIKKITETIAEARKREALVESAEELEAAIHTLNGTTETLLRAMKEESIDLATANSAKYLDMFGHIVVAWMWLMQGLVADKALANQPHEDDVNFYSGKLQAMRYFFRYDLSEIEGWAKLLAKIDDTTFEMKSEWF